MTDVLVISGPAGVGKSATAYEVSLQLRAAGVAHAVVDTDALDHLHPAPPEGSKLTERNLACVWAGLAAEGAHRLVLTGVYLDRHDQLSWIRRATRAERITCIRLTGSEATLVERVVRREVGSGRERQIERTLAQARAMGATPPDGVELVATDGRPVAAVAAQLIGIVGWRASPADDAAPARGAPRARP